MMLIWEKGIEWYSRGLKRDGVESGGSRAGNRYALDMS